MLWPRIIRTKKDHRRAVKEIRELIELERRSREDRERLELLALLVDRYEREVFPRTGTDEVTAVDVVVAWLEERGEKPACLAPALGGRSRVSEFLNGHRDLSRAQIERLHEFTALPIDLLFRKDPHPVES